MLIHPFPPLNYHKIRRKLGKNRTAKKWTAIHCKGTQTKCRGWTKTFGREKLWKAPWFLAKHYENSLKNENQWEKKTQSDRINVKNTPHVLCLCVCVCVCVFSDCAEGFMALSSRATSWTVKWIWWKEPSCTWCGDCGRPEGIVNTEAKALPKSCAISFGWETKLPELLRWPTEGHPTFFPQMYKWNTLGLTA